jgi:hypothetical protein
MKLDLRLNLRTAIKRAIVFFAVLQIVDESTGPVLQFTNFQSFIRYQLVDF